MSFVNMSGEIALQQIGEIRQDDYVNPEGYVPTSFSELKEQNISPFLEYSRNTPIGQLSVGGRYEWVNFDYYEDGKYMEGQSRNFSNFFPSVSLGSEIGGVQFSLVMRQRRVVRPTSS